MQNLPRPEYPRPRFVRENWINLNGEWQFEIDHGKSGKARGLMSGSELKDRIIVPFCPESELSGVNHKDFMECVWYRRVIVLPEGWQNDGRRTILHIGACDYRAEVWVNGKSAGTHFGGYVSFSFDITALLQKGENEIVICAEDNLRSHTQPGGKQSTKFASYGCSYTRTTGIWQTAWMENVPAAYIAETKCTPDIEAGTLSIEAVCADAHGMTLKAEATWNGKTVGVASGVVTGKSARMTLKLDELHLWSNEDPALYDLKLTLGEDAVQSYFGMRSIAYVDGKLLLNGKVVFQRLVLDQGFYPDGIYTAPTDEALKGDILMSMAMGFNGARLHEKVFEPRFLYHCDKLGYLVWGEHANWCLDISRVDAYKNFLPEWLEVMRRDYNHPAIIGWCPLNETQEDQDPDFVKSLAALTRAYDSTRPYIDASGWTHVSDTSDILDLHDYDQDPVSFKAKMDKIAAGEPVKSFLGGTFCPSFISEYGGIWWSNSDDGWGYGDRPTSEEEFIARFKGLTEAILDCPAICALCYTQLTDVEQEQNGLYTYDRKAKFDPAIISAILKRKAAIEE